MDFSSPATPDCVRITSCTATAVANRIMCDFLHRKKVPLRLAQSDRNDDFWGQIGEAA